MVQPEALAKISVQGEQVKTVPLEALELRKVVVGRLEEVIEEQVRGASVWEAMNFYLPAILRSLCLLQ